MRACSAGATTRHSDLIRHRYEFTHNENIAQQCEVPVEEEECGRAGPFPSPEKLHFLSEGDDILVHEEHCEATLVSHREQDPDGDWSPVPANTQQLSSNL